MARTNDSLLQALKHLQDEIWGHRWHIFLAFKRDFKMLSRVTKLSTVWNYVLPLVPISVYVVLMGLRMFPSFGNVSAVVYVATGVSLWFLFAGMVQRPVSIVEGNMRTIIRTDFPLIGAIITGFAQLTFDTVVRFTAVIVVIFIFHGLPAWQTVFVPLILLAAGLFFTGLGLILSMLNMAFRDISKIVPIILQYGIFLSSVIFPVDRIEFLKAALNFNPFYIFIENIRSLIVEGQLHSAMPLVIFSVLGVLMFLFACKFFYVLELRFRGLA